MGRVRRLVVSSVIVAVVAGCGSSVEVDDSASTGESSETNAVGESSLEVEGAIEPGDDGGDTDYEPPSEEESTDAESDGTSTGTQTTIAAPKDESGDVWQDEEEPEGDEYDYWSDFAKLEVSEEVPRDGYDRDGWRHWIDGSNSLWGRNDANCDTRELIVKWSEVLLVPQDWDGCDPPVDGAWFSDYDGAWTTDSSTFDLDHVVSLAEAWDSGGSSWSAERRETFANDPLNLVLVSASSLLSKGDKDVAEWKPSEHLHCSMAATVVIVKVRYELTVDQVEHDALNEMLETCANNWWGWLRAGLGRAYLSPFVEAAIKEHSSTAPSGQMFIEGMFWPNNSCPTDVGVAVYELEDGRTPMMILLLDDVIVDDDVNFTFTGIEVQVGQNVFTEAGYFLISIGTDVRDVEPGTYQARAEVSDGVSTEILEFEVVVDECGGQLVDGVAIRLFDFQTNASNCGDGCIHLIFDFDLTYNVSRPLSVKWQHDFSEYGWMSEERELPGGFAQDVRLRSYQTLTFASSAECEAALYDKLLPLLIEVEHETGATVLDASGFWIDEGCT